MGEPACLDDFQRDGFLFFRDRLPKDLVAQAHADLERCFQQDAQERRDKAWTRMVHRGSVGVSHVTPVSHLLIDVYGKSPALDAVVEQIFTDPVMGSVLERTLGKHYKLRGLNIRRMNGKFDPGPEGPCSLPHEWHRDWRGELGIAILLTDVPPGGNGGTALLPGSHTYPYCPRGNTLFCPTNLLGPLKVPLVPWILNRINLFSRLLGKKVLGSALEATGQRGDLYYFFNDTWHGRAKNLHGRETMVVFIGLFPTEFPFPDAVELPAADVMAALPPRLRQALRHDQPLNTGRDTLMHRMLAEQKPAPVFSLFALARLERRLADIIFAPILLYLWLKKNYKSWTQRLVEQVRGWFRAESAAAREGSTTVALPASHTKLRRKAG